MQANRLIYVIPVGAAGPALVVRVSGPRMRLVDGALRRALPRPRQPRRPTRSKVTFFLEVKCKLNQEDAAVIAPRFATVEVLVNAAARDNGAGLSAAERGEIRRVKQ